MPRFDGSINQIQAEKFWPWPPFRVTRKQHDRLCREASPRKGRWAGDTYLRLTGRTNRFIDLTDGNVEAVPAPADE